MKSRNITGNSLEMIIEVRAAQEAELVREIAALEGVSTAALLSHDGEVTY